MSGAESDLNEYLRKRDFKRTPEPRGRKERARVSDLVFTVQKHEARRLHYDLRLEWNGVLLSWAVTRGPSADPAEKRLAVRTENHPLSYARFEGDIPRGEYGAGHVMLWDEGAWQPLDDPAKGLKAGKLHFRLQGRRMQGGWVLVRMRGKGREKHENWLLIKERDEYAEEDSDRLTREFTSSIRSSSEAGALPRFREPQLATLVDRPPQGDNWLHETKYDGYRALAAIAGGQCRLYTRSGKDWSEKFSPLLPALASLPCRNALLDGEVMPLSNGTSAFSSLQQALSSGAPLQYFVFDLLLLDDRELGRQPLLERKQALKKLLERTNNTNRKVLHYSEHVRGKGEDVHAGICKAGGEGIVSKQVDSPYQHRRSRSWLKIKCTRRQEFVIGGFSPSSVRGRAFASLAAGDYQQGKLIYRGRVGTGFDARTMQELAERMAPLVRKTPPFEKVPAGAARGMQWLRPALVMEVNFTEFTTDGHIRHGVYLGLREDKAPEEVHMERPVQQAPEAADLTLHGIRISHPGREIFPGAGFTKGDLAHYYASCGKRMNAILAEHPLSLVRCPDGISGECFFQKHRGKGFPEELQPVTMEESGGKKREYFFIASVQGILAAAQFNAIEFHGWACRQDRLDRPARLVFDLDPDPSVPFSAVVEAAFELRSLLGAAGLDSIPLLTGGKGVHVVVILHRSIDWDTLKHFAKLVAGMMEARAPSRFVAKAAKAKRKGRIFVDWLRNTRGATAIMPWSARARPGAPVAVPLTWPELGERESAADFHLGNVDERLALPCPYSRALRKPQRITLQTLESFE